MLAGRRPVSFPTLRRSTSSTSTKPRRLWTPSHRGFSAPAPASCSLTTSPWSPRSPPRCSYWTSRRCPGWRASTPTSSSTTTCSTRACRRLAPMPYTLRGSPGKGSASRFSTAASTACTTPTSRTRSTRCRTSKSSSTRTISSRLGRTRPSRSERAPAWSSRIFRTRRRRSATARTSRVSSERAARHQTATTRASHLGPI